MVVYTCNLEMNGMAEARGCVGGQGHMVRQETKDWGRPVFAVL
jgi:hypothetical protein